MLTLLLLPTLLESTHLEDVLSDYIVTPFGYWDKNCVHGVDAGSEIVNYDTYFHVKKDGNFISEKKRCNLHNSTHIRERINKAKKLDGIIRAVDGDGWQEYTKMNSGDTTTGLLGDWVVPPIPSQVGSQILYMFTGLQNIDWVPPEKEPSKAFDIIQPVMTFGHSPPSTGAGRYWSCASWYVTLGSDVVYSKPFGEMTSGDKIFGNMTKTGSDSWYINCVDTNTNKDSPLTITRSILSEQPWIYVTLEVYNTYSCDEYPLGAPVPFTNLALYQNGAATTIDWTVGTNGQSPPICNSSVAVNSPTEVTITF